MCVAQLVVDGKVNGPVCVEVVGVERTGAAAALLVEGQIALLALESVDDDSDAEDATRL